MDWCLSVFSDLMMQQWRVEVTPGSPRRDDLFLHVIEVGDQKLAAMAPAGYKVDAVVVAIGNSPNPLIPAATPAIH